MNAILPYGLNTASSLPDGKYLAQLDPQVRDGILGNAGTIVSFRWARRMRIHWRRSSYPEFATADVVNLPNYSVYLKLMVNGTVSRPFSAEMLPLLG